MPRPAGACTKRLLCSASGLGRLRLKRTLYSSIFGSRYLDTWGWEEGCEGILRGASEGAGGRAAVSGRTCDQQVRVVTLCCSCWLSGLLPIVQYLCTDTQRVRGGVSALSTGGRPHLFMNATASCLVSKRGHLFGNAATASCQYSSSSSGKTLRSMLCLEVSIVRRKARSAAGSRRQSQVESPSYAHYLRAECLLVMLSIPRPGCFRARP